MAKLKAAIITDIHNGPHIRAKLGHRAKELLRKFVAAVNKGAADLIVDMGDRITGKDEAIDRARMADVKSEFNKAAMPTYHVMGNHDLMNLTRTENEQITGSPAGSWSMDAGGYHLVFFNPGADAGNDLSAGQGDIDWLRADLAAADKATIVFSHVPLDNQSEHDDELRPEHRELHARFGYAAMGPKIRQVMEQSDKVILCMSGHIHAHRYTQIGGIHYVTQQSLTHEHQDYYKVPSNSWSWLELEDGKIALRFQGRSRRDYFLTAKVCVLGGQ